jgi:hypothetical protein
MASGHLEGTIRELAALPGLPDAKTIRQKMKRKMQNLRGLTTKFLQDHCPCTYSIDMVDALIVKHFGNTPGAKSVQVTQAVADAVEGMDESGEDLLVRLYNELVPAGHNTLMLDGANDPRLVESASDL